MHTNRFINGKNLMPNAWTYPLPTSNIQIVNYIVRLGDNNRALGTKHDITVSMARTRQRCPCCIKGKSSSSTSWKYPWLPLAAALHNPPSTTMRASTAIRCSLSGPNNLNNDKTNKAITHTQRESCNLSASANGALVAPHH